MEIIGSDKIGFISMAKHGSSTLETLLHDYDFINLTQENLKEYYQSEKILLFPWRDEFESVKSGFFQEIATGLVRLLWDNPQDPKDESLFYIFRYLFNKKNNSNVLNVNSGQQIISQKDFLEFFLIDYDKFYFFDLKHLSNPELIEWISEHDSRWKNVSIPQKKIKKSETSLKEQLKNILSQIKDELGDDYLDYEDIQDWTTVTHYYEFSKKFFELRKKSEQFLNFD